MIQNRVRTSATLILGQGEVLTLRLPGRPLRLACVAGRLWATTNRSGADHLLAPGEVRTFRGRGTLVVQALRIATARIEGVPVTRALAVDASTPPGVEFAKCKPTRSSCCMNTTTGRTAGS